MSLSLPFDTIDSAALAHDLRRRMTGPLAAALIATDEAGRIERWDENAEILYGWSPDEVVGASILDVTTRAFDAELASGILSRLAVGEAWEGAFPVVRKDGTQFTAYVRDYPVVEHGEVVAIVGLSVPNLRTDPYAFCSVPRPSLAASRPEHFLEVRAVGPALELRGELDFSGAPLLSRAIAKAIDDGAQFVSVDLERLRFIDASGLGVLVSARSHLVGFGGALVLRAPSPMLRRILDITDLTSLFAIER